jgi:hypothetical protein
MAKSNQRMDVFTAPFKLHPLVWRGLLCRLNSLLFSGPYSELHDDLVMHEFCEAFKLDPVDVWAAIASHYDPSNNTIH